MSFSTSGPLRSLACANRLAELRFRENLYIIKTLKEFQYIDEEGRDQGANGPSRLEARRGEAHSLRDSAAEGKGHLKPAHGRGPVARRAAIASAHARPNVGQAEQRPRTSSPRSKRPRRPTKTAVRRHLLSHGHLF